MPAGATGNSEDLLKDAAASTGALPGARARKGSWRLRAVTWNIHGCVGMDGRRSLVRTGRVITAMAPDIAAFQEVDLRRKAGFSIDAARYLRELVGGHGHEAWALSGSEGHYGQILASRYPLERRQVHDVSVRGREPRKVMEAVVRLPGGALRVLATHLGLFPAERRHQVSLLREIVMQDLSLPILLLGDLNEWRRPAPGQAPYDVFETQTLHKSFPSPLPTLAFDRILCRGDVSLTDSRVVRGAFMASDHLPVVAGISVAVRR